VAAYKLKDAPKGSNTLKSFRSAVLQSKRNQETIFLHLS